MRRILGSFLPFVLAACVAAAPSDAPGAPAIDRRPHQFVQAVDEAFGLDFFGSCDEVLSFLQQHALQRVTAWGLDGWGWGWAEGGRDFAGSLAGVAADAAAPMDHSVTNVQEAGVDEPDVVKTNGRIIVALAQGKLHVVDVTGAKPRLVGSLALDEPWGSQLFLYNDVALIISSHFQAFDIVGVEFAPWGGEPQTKVTLVDLSDPSAPRVESDLSIDGSFVAARLTGSAARLVVTSGANRLPFVTPDQFINQMPEQVRPMIEQPLGGDPWRLAEERALATNRQVILSSTVDDWFPHFALHGEGGLRFVQEGSLAQCDRMAHPAEFSGMGITSIVTLDLDKGLWPVDNFGLVSDASTVYASTDSMYVATQQWIDFARMPAADQARVVERAITEIHRFDLTDPNRTTFAGSGRVPGWLYSQWALSEHEGRLRVASTTESPWWGWQPGNSQSMVTILEPEDGRLATVGQVSGLGAGEQIYAVRFIGDTGYVVTFRQTDPLYVIDLRDPMRPEVSSELKIPGYSAYLHPIGNGLLLGVGQDADLNGTVKGTQVSVFDVSNPRDPRRIDKITLPGGYSEAEWDHHAFLYWPKTGLAVIPVQQWNGNQSFSGALAIKAGSKGMTELGEIEHPSGYLQRSLVVGDRLYTLSDVGIMGNDLDTLDEVAWLVF